MKAFTLVEVLVGTFLILTVFLGISGLYQLAFKVIALSERKITATALINAEMEKIRNLSYRDAGTQGASLPFAEGLLESSTTTWRDNVEYAVEKKIKYVIDSADGLGEEDSCNWDYKKAEIKVSWSGRFQGSIKATSDIAPKNKVEETQTCVSQPGGILSVSVFDAQGVMVPSPLIEVSNPSTGALLDFATPISGEYDFPLATATYKIAVSKAGFSQERTYGTEEVAIPDKPHPLVLEGEITETSFSIDESGSFQVSTLSPWGQSQFQDAFLDETKISEKSDLAVSDGQVVLATGTQGYLSLGNLSSLGIEPSGPIRWDEFSFSDLEQEEDNDLKYRIYFSSSTQWYLVSDADLPGNSSGFDLSPVDISGLATTTYGELKVRADFSTLSTSTSPVLYDWQVSWITSSPVEIPDVDFQIRSSKTIGEDNQEQPVYKYFQGFSSDSQGNRSIADLEWDNYTFSLATPTSLDLVSTDPGPQPVALAPASATPVKLYLEAENSLLAIVENLETLEPVFSASVRATKTSLGYDKTQYADEAGQTYFIPLSPAVYDLEIQAPGFLATATQASVSGDAIKIIKLQQVE